MPPNSMGVLTALLVNVLICFGVPIGGFIILKHYGKKIFKPFLLGALTFFVSQIVLRIPIIYNVLPYQSWYVVLSQHTVAYSLFLGVTAGLFEEIGRFLCMKYLMKSWREMDGIAFGLGHGGIEAVLLVGINMLIILISMLALTFGTADTLSQIFGDTFADTLVSSIKRLTVLNVLMGGIERILAMGMHIGMSMLVLHGLKRKKAIQYLLAAILIHTVVDSSIGILSILGIGIVGIEIFNFLIAGILIAYTISSIKKNKDQMY